VTTDTPLPTAAPNPARPALCAATLCVCLLQANPSQAGKAKPPRAASTPSTAQILAPSQATQPDALPVPRAIYRCGNSYSPHPCGGTPPLDVGDARSEAQRRQAEELALRDKHLAQWLEAGRRERETVASAPSRHRADTAGCVDTVTMVCKPRKPKPRHSVTKAASAAAAAARISSQ
jgi:hypothetical protein